MILMTSAVTMICAEAGRKKEQVILSPMVKSRSASISMPVALIFTEWQKNDKASIVPSTVTFRRTRNAALNEIPRSSCAVSRRTSVSNGLVRTESALHFELSSISDRIFAQMMMSKTLDSSGFFLINDEIDLFGLMDLQRLFVRVGSEYPYVRSIEKAFVLRDRGLNIGRYDYLYHGRLALSGVFQRGCGEDRAQCWSP